MKGTVRSVDVKGKSLVVTGADGKDSTVQFDEKSVVTLDGVSFDTNKANALDGVKVGDSVSVSGKDVAIR